MPELPEVERVRRGLADAVTGRTIVGARAEAAHRHLRRLDESVGRLCASVERRGKVLVVPLLDPQGGPPLELIGHLGMTGRLLVGRVTDPHLRAVLTLDSGIELSFVDPRRFGRLMVCDPGHYPTLPMLATIAPDPDDVDPQRFTWALAKSRRPIKACLLDQRIVAGVGNIYADEVLHRARLSPQLPADQISVEAAHHLLELLRQLLREAVTAGGTTFRDYRAADGSAGAFQHQLQVYGRANSPCLACQTPLQHATVSGRSTVWCPACQPAPAAKTPVG